MAYSPCEGLLRQLDPKPVLPVEPFYGTVVGTADYASKRTSISLRCKCRNEARQVMDLLASNLLN